MTHKKRKPKIKPLWLEDKAITKWLNQLPSERTKKNYRQEFPHFLRWFHEVKKQPLTPSQIIEDRFKSLGSPETRRKWEQIHNEYKVYLIKRNLAEVTITSYLRTLWSFFTYNACKLMLTRSDRKVRETKQAQANHVKAFYPETNDIKEMYAHADSRDKAILLIHYHSGLSSVDVSNLNIEDLDFYDSEGKFVKIEHKYLEMARSKTREKVQTCLSEEALENIRIMLRERGFPQKGALFLSSKGSRIDVRYINLAMKNLSEKAFGKEITKRFSASNLRDSYNDRLLFASTEGLLIQEVKDAMMGHKRESARGKYLLSPATIKKAYNKIFHLLSINHRRKIRELEARLKQLDELEATMRTLAKYMLEIQQGKKLSKQRIAELHGIATTVKEK